MRPSSQKEERECYSIQEANNEKNMDPQILNQIESLIQQQFRIFVPALVFEYRPTKSSGTVEFSGWDYNDLCEFFSSFGEIEF